MNWGNLGVGYSRLPAYRILPTVSRLLVAATRLEIGANPLAGTIAELGKLSGARVNDGLNLFLWLLGDGYDAIEILVHKQTHEHLREGKRERAGINMSRPAGMTQLVHSASGWQLHWQRSLYIWPC